MSDYNSGDDLLDNVDPDELLCAGSKRSLDDDGQTATKRIKLEATTDDEKYQSIAQSLLKENFNYSEFRHEQAQAITATLRGDNTLVIFPTSAGKSLCYQIPGIAFPEVDAQGLTGRDPKSAGSGSGITIVVSPLIALMKDQVDALKRRNIPAACLDSTKTWEETKEITAAMQEGKLRILYCAPERLNNEGFVATIKYVAGGIRLVAVDEAQCISEWGHSFRPDYLKVARFIQEIKAERVICLTATATPRVAEDICNAFSIKDDNVFRTSPYRPNLTLQAEAIEKKGDKFARLLQFLANHPGPTLVYASVQKETEELAEMLCKNNYCAAPFHAGLPTAQKTKTQDQFMAGEIQIIVATIAFGMGIDKPDIRNIIHYAVASTVEEYSQQIGRAGRDGKPSFCMVYLCNDDFPTKENFARGDTPSIDSLQNLLEDIFFNQERSKMPDGKDVIKMSHYALGRDHDIRPNPLTIILALVELRYGLIRAITLEYSSYQFEALPSYFGRFKHEKSREAKAIFDSATKAKKWFTLDVLQAANSAGLVRADVVRRLNEIDGTHIKLKVSGVMNRYKVLKKLPSTSKEVSELADKLHAEQLSREKDAIARFQGIIKLLTGQQCFAQALAVYFGTQLPGNKTSCGHCTFCLTKKPITLPPKPKVRVDLVGIDRILTCCPIRDDPRFLARVAFGIKSPRVTKEKLDKKSEFGSLEDHDFESLLEVFTKACVKAGYKPRNQSS
ncbi:ATP-dependent DNA helicase recQ [Xylariaceae sp. FL0255]|nr:ATP-dependent DNA helicase recQ [Xylariaceae sp. FL0255]